MVALNPQDETIEFPDSHRRAMKTSKPFILAALTALLTVSVWPQEMHRHDAAEKLGQVNFPVSCTDAAQKQFNHALALLHSFQYREAEKAFSAVNATDRNCAMSYWGIAMSNYHPLWVPPNAEASKKGFEAVEQAKSLNARTQRERDYIAALAMFYKDANIFDHRTRARA